MRCLIAVILILGVIIGSAVAAWMWLRWWGLAVWFFGWYALLWLLSKIGPGASAGFFRGMYADLASSMHGATVTLHSIERATDSDPVREIMRDIEEWIGDDDSDEAELHFQVDEFLSHCEIRLDCGRFLIDVTITPPEDDPDVQWAPHGFSLVPADVGADRSFSCEILQWEDYDTQTSQFVPTKLETAFEEIQGERRMRLLAALDEDNREYRFEYLFSNRYETPVVLLPATDAVDPMRRLATAIIDRIMRANDEAKDITSVSLSFLPIDDDDVERLCELGELEYLGLDHTQVTDEGVKRIAEKLRLQQLSLNGTFMTDAALDAISGLADLQRLFVRQTRVTKAGVESFRAARPRVKVYR